MAGSLSDKGADLFELLDEISELVYVVDIENYELLFMNTAGCKMYGMTDVRGRKCYEVLHGLGKPCDFCNNDCIASGDFITRESDNQVLNRHYLLKDRLVEYQGRKSKIEIAFDITEKENQKKDLETMLNAQTMVLECVKLLHVSEDVYEALGTIVDNLGVFLDADRAYIYMMEEDRMENYHSWYMGGETELKVLPDVDLEMVTMWNHYCKKNKQTVFEDIERIREGCPEGYAELKARNIHSIVLLPLEVESRSIGYIGVDNPSVEKMRNIAAMLDTLSYFVASSILVRKKQEKLERMSYHDTLTGALNRNAYIHAMERIASQAASSLGIVYIDINDMKGINDRYGHQYGDLILAGMLQKIAKYFELDQIYRVGGDEFVVLAQGLSQDEFEDRAEGLKLHFKQETEYNASMGRRWSADNGKLAELVSEADQMMYEDKKNFYHSKSVSKRYRHHLDEILEFTKPGVLEGMLEEGRFLVYYQPKVGVENRELIGSEALVRYCAPNGRIVPPNQFIPLLEETNLISMIDFYVFDQVCFQVDEWIRKGQKAAPVSVNFSRNSLSERHFLDKLISIHSKYDIPLNSVEIEITESADVGDDEYLLKVIEEVRKRGFSISLDDFGIKYANFGLFTSVDFDVLKIDKSLAMNLQKNEKSRTVLRSISEICRQMGVHIIVEGIENEEQMQVLKDLQCDGAQGYLFSQPLALDEFEAQFMQNGSQEAP